MLSDAIRVKESIDINLAPKAVYQFWRNLENLPLFMSHLKRVKTLDHKRSHWEADAALGTSVEWDAVIVNEVENKMISWKSNDDASVENEGSVCFEDKGSGEQNCTHLVVEMSYKPPLGKLGDAIANFFGKDPSKKIKEDLKKLKCALEATESSNISKKTHS